MNSTQMSTCYSGFNTASGSSVPPVLFTAVLPGCNRSRAGEEMRCSCHDNSFPPKTRCERATEGSFFSSVCLNSFKQPRRTSVPAGAFRVREPPVETLKINIYAAAHLQVLPLKVDSLRGGGRFLHLMLISLSNDLLLSSTVTHGQTLSGDDAFLLQMEAAQLFWTWNFTQIENDANVIMGRY